MRTGTRESISLFDARRHRAGASRGDECGPLRTREAHGARTSLAVKTQLAEEKRCEQVFETLKRDNFRRSMKLDTTRGHMRVWVPSASRSVFKTPYAFQVCRVRVVKFCSLGCLGPVLMCGCCANDDAACWGHHHRS